jgi:hypothetical protein
MFEGLGLGSRLAYLPLPERLNWVPFLGAVVYAVMTPIGVAIGLGVRTTYDAESEAAQIVSGVLDALSAGILLLVWHLIPFPCLSTYSSLRVPDIPVLLSCSLTNSCMCI